MASSSSLTLSATQSSLPNNWKYHVFPSFHGADVRNNFLSHILKEFKSRAIDLFIDNDIERSKSIGPELIEAIKGSRIAIVLLSMNYASSTWCLNELEEIINRRDEFSQTVIPIFYQVNPTDIKKQKGYFGKVFRKTCKGKRKEEILRWKHALKEVAQIEGYHSTNWKTEADMIEHIATDVSNKLNLSAPCSDFDDLVGMESQTKRMESFLQLDSEEVRKIGILGPPGIGKTTIARSLFNQHSQDFQLSVFIDNIKRKYAIPSCSDNYSVKLHLQKQFMSQLTNETCVSISHLGVVKDRLKDKKALVVLDDVDHLEQLEAMAKETYWFGPGSRIIITTQDQRVLKASGVNHIHRVMLPSYHEALQMFCMYAFGQKDPKDGFGMLACEVINLVGKLPLGLKVMGSYFRGMSKNDWIESLPSLRIHLDRDGEIASILKFSYDALNDEDKRLFLHIACFFSGEPVEMVEICLANFFENVRQGLCILSERSLISMESVWIEMPKLLVQIGRQIVQKEFVNEPGKRQYLNDANDISQVLSDYKASNSSVIGINLEWDEKITSTSERAFKRLSNLQFLRIFGKGINPKSLNYISRKLKVLIWPMFPMSCFPSSFKPEFLVELCMSGSKLEKLWKGNKPLNNLKWMDLHDSERLKELPDLSTATNLQKLNLSDCSSLVKLPSSIGNAINLKTLDLSDCFSLVKLPSSIGNAMNLQELNLHCCSSLVELTSSIGNAVNLEDLDLSYCSRLVKIPTAIGNAVNLKKLDLNYCSGLVEIPSTIMTITNLRSLRLDGCSSLVELPDLSTATNLQEFNLSYCSSLVKLPSSVGNAFNLQKMFLTNCSSLVELPFSIGHAVNLKKLYLSHCSSLMELPSSMINLSELWDLKLEKCSKLEVNLANINLESLRELDLSGCSLLKSYPRIRRISRLRILRLRRMKKLVTLPQLPDSILFLDAENCELLERLDCSFRNPDIRLNFANCFRLNKEARDLIIQTPTDEYAVFPAEEVPTCFTYRSSGSSVTVKLHQLPVGKSTKFKACFICADDGENNFGLWESASVCCSITSGGIALTACYKKVQGVYPENLYTFVVDVETEKVTSTELVFQFDISSLEYNISKKWKIKECGILQLLEVPLLS